MVFYYRKELKKNISNFILPLAIFIPSLILSLQPLYKLSFLPERFASLVGLSTYFFFIGIITIPQFKGKVKILAVIPLFLNYLSADSLIINKGYRSYSAEEIRFYNVIKPLINPNSIVFVPSEYFYWGRYFLEDSKVIPGEHFVSCGNITDEKYFDEDNFTFAKILAENNPDTGKELIQKLKSIHPNKKIYILANSNLQCGHGRVLQKVNNLRQISNINSWHLYEII